MADEDSRPYAGQEGEINDKLLLDAAWERQQKKVSSAVGGCVHGWTQTSMQACALIASAVCSYNLRGACMLHDARVHLRAEPTTCRLACYNHTLSLLRIAHSSKRPLQ